MSNIYLKGDLAMKKIFTFSILILLVLTFSTNIMAADWEVSGGYLYTTINMETEDLYGGDFINSGIEEIPELNDVTDYDKLDPLENADGYYFGIGKNVVDYLVTLRYENFSNEETGFIEGEEGVNGSITTNKFEITSEIEVDGLVIEVGNQINKNFKLNFSVGHYNSDLEERVVAKENGEIIADYGGNILYDVDSGFGYKVGAEYNYNISPNWSINAAANYRVLSLDYEIDKLVSNEGSVSLPNVEDRDKYSGELDLDGYEITAGLSLTF